MTQLRNTKNMGGNREMLDEYLKMEYNEMYEDLTKRDKNYRDNILERSIKALDSISDLYLPELNHKLYEEIQLLKLIARDLGEAEDID